MLVAQIVANLGAFNVVLMVGEMARDRNSWPNTVAQPCFETRKKPFFETMPRHYPGIEGPNFYTPPTPQPLGLPF